ncbi:MAG: hypothetical protein AAF423_07270 [Pseudomonadota bacterium]
MQSVEGKEHCCLKLLRVLVPAIGIFFALFSSALAQVVNGDFSAGGTGWTVVAPGTTDSVTFTGGVLTATANDIGATTAGPNLQTLGQQTFTAGDTGFLSYSLVSYTSTDIGDFDFPVVLIDGTTFRIQAGTGNLIAAPPAINNGSTFTTPPLNGATVLAAGSRTIAFGVETLDSGFGPGIATWDNIEFQELTQSPGAQTTDEDIDLTLSGASALQVATNGNVATMTVTISVTNGTLSLGSPGSVTITGGADGSATVTFTGSAAAINTALAGTVYSPNTDFNGSDTLTFTVNAGGTIDTDTVPITVNPIDDFRFTIAKVVDITSITTLATLNYTITVTNTGDASLTSVIFTDVLTQNGVVQTLTTGPTLTSGDTNSNNNLDAGEIWIYNASFDALIGNLADGNDLINTATFNAAEVSAQSDTATTTIDAPNPPGGVPSACTGTDFAVNGGFETPPVPGAPPTFALLPQASVPGWTTTDSLGQIELWDSGFLGVVSDTGLQHAELNANSAGTLTGTGSVTSRAEMLYFWAHRARSLATETASLTITDDAGGSTVFGNYSSGTAAWNSFVAVHLANPGATTYSAAHSTVLGGSIGNFHDSIQVCQTFITLNKAEFSRQDLDTSGGDSAGDTITYRFTVSNPAGNERNVGSVSVTDDQIGTINFSFPSSPDSGDTNGNGLLDPGEAWIRDVTYTLTQADLDAGSVTNIASASADTGDNILSTDNSTVTATLTTNPSISVTKTANDTTDVTLGQSITYTYVVQNNGNQTVSGISLLESHNGSGAPPVPSNETLTTDAGTIGDSSDASNNGIWDVLAPGDAVTFTGTYVVTQNDIDTLQ